MPQKRNPINFENVKSLWKTYAPRMATVYMDQISDHQRDLTNSASGRFLPEILAALFMSANRTNSVMKKLSVDKQNMKRNFDMSKNMLIAEPLYIILASKGHSDAHEAVRKLTLKSQQTGWPLFELAQEDDETKDFVSTLSNTRRIIQVLPQRRPKTSAISGQIK
jgi:adenylosuccinate lyase